MKKDVDEKVPNTSDLVTATNLNTKISEAEKKIPEASGLTVLNTKISEVENKIPDNSKYTTQEFNKLPA